MLHYSALIDFTSGALLTFGQHTSIIAFLAKSAMGRACYSVNFPKYLNSFPLLEVGFQEYPEWTWNRQDRVFSPTPKELITDRVRATSSLAVRKSNVLFEIIQGISTARNQLCSGVLMQETVNVIKRQQAQKFKDEGFPEDDMLRYPYVLQYAEIAELPLKTAALEILFKSQLDDEILAKTEGLRLRYFDLVKNAELDTIESVLTRFRGEQLW